MEDSSLERSFGLVIAFLLPGFVSLVGASRFSPLIAGWMSIAPTSDLTVVGFLYVVLASIALGMVTGAVRWATIDTLHHRTGLRPPTLDFSKLQENLGGFRLAVEHNYRHYQHYSGMAVASLFFMVCDQLRNGIWQWSTLLAFLVLEVVLMAASRDCLRRYYERSQQLLGDASACCGL